MAPIYTATGVIATFASGIAIVRMQAGTHVLFVVNQNGRAVASFRLLRNARTAATRLEGDRS